MAGRNKYPYELIEGRSGGKHFTKQEKEERKNSEIQLTHVEINPSEELLGNEEQPENTRALQEFYKLKELYSDIKFIGTLDEPLINQYCLAVSELEVLTKLNFGFMEQSRDKNVDSAERQIAINQMLQLSPEIRLKRQQIVAIGDKLYLNPVSRAKAVMPKDEPKKETDFDKEFGDV